MQQNKFIKCPRRRTYFFGFCLLIVFEPSFRYLTSVSNFRHLDLTLTKKSKFSFRPQIIYYLKLKSVRFHDVPGYINLNFKGLYLMENIKYERNFANIYNS